MAHRGADQHHHGPLPAPGFAYRAPEQVIGPGNDRLLPDLRRDRPRQPPGAGPAPTWVTHTNPASYAMITSWTRSRASSLDSRRVRYVFAVATLMKSRSGYLALDRPVPTRVRTSRCGP